MIQIVIFAHFQYRYTDEAARRSDIQRNQSILLQRIIFVIEYKTV